MLDTGRCHLSTVIFGVLSAVPHAMYPTCAPISHLQNVVGSGLRLRTLIVHYDVTGSTLFRAFSCSAAPRTSCTARSAHAHADNTVQTPRAAQDPRCPFCQREHACAHLRRAFPSVCGLHGARGAHGTDRCGALRVVFDMIKAQGPALV